MLASFRNRLPALASVLRPVQSIARASTVAEPASSIQKATNNTQSRVPAIVPSKEIIQNVNNQLAKNEAGRLFAVVHLAGKQFKVTPGDILVVEGYWPPQNGDKIRLDKVLVAGGRDFSLIGTPLVNPGLVDVQATVIEKTLSHIRTHFKSKRRKQFMRINFYRSENTMIRINSIELTKPVNSSS